MLSLPLRTYSTIFQDPPSSYSNAYRRALRLGWPLGGQSHPLVQPFKMIQKRRIISMEMNHSSIVNRQGATTLRHELTHVVTEPKGT